MVEASPGPWIPINNCNSPTVKHVWNIAMHVVLHIFLSKSQQPTFWADTAFISLYKDLHDLLIIDKGRSCYI